jgi:hypothetical protein
MPSPVKKNPYFVTFPFNQIYYFKIIAYSYSGMRTNTAKSYATFTYFFPLLTICKTIIYYHNYQDIEIDTVNIQSNAITGRILRVFPLHHNMPYHSVLLYPILTISKHQHVFHFYSSVFQE